jgi:hypothetical protein
MLRKLLARPTSVILAWLLSAPFLVACAKPSLDVSVSVHGVNYSGQTFSYYFVDPDPKSNGVGESIEPFSAGGTTCCFSLPKKWRPGIKVQIHSKHWLPKLPDGSLPTVEEDYSVDVPRYPDGKPGELWVLRATDGSLSVISSDFQPDHPKWPGKVKGWPIPSIEYQREIWERLRKHQQDGVEVYLSLLDELEKDPKRRTKAAWEFSQEYDRATLKNFSGPEDPRYAIALKKEYEDGLKRSNRLLKEVMDAKP